MHAMVLSTRHSMGNRRLTSDSPDQIWSLLTRAHRWDLGWWVQPAEVLSWFSLPAFHRLAWGPCWGYFHLSLDLQLTRSMSGTEHLSLTSVRIPTFTLLRVSSSGKLTERYCDALWVLWPAWGSANQQVSSNHVVRLILPVLHVYIMYLNHTSITHPSPSLPPIEPPSCSDIFVCVAHFI